MARFNASVILAACIVAAALIVSSFVVAHRPGPAQVSTASMPSAKPAAMPPIAQESVEEQFRTQVLAAPSLHSYSYNGKQYILVDVKVDNVIYTAKEDDFTITCDWIFQPAIPQGGPQGSYCDLSNDGYGHYYGSISLNPLPGSPGLNANVTIK